MREPWPLVPLEQVAEVSIGRQRSPRNAEGDHMVQYLRAANVKDGRVEVGDVLEMDFTPIEQETFMLAFGDVLVSEGCGSIRELGASAMWRGDLPGTVCFQNTLLRLRARPSVATSGFIELIARWLHHSGGWASVASGTNIFHIGRGRAAEVPVPCPPLAEQRRIVDLVEALDGYTASAAELAMATAPTRASLLDDLFIEGETVELGDLVELVYGRALPEPKRSGTGFPVLGAAGPVGLHATPSVSKGPVIVVGRKGVHAKATFSPGVRDSSGLPGDLYRGVGGAGTVRWCGGPCSVIDTAFSATPRDPRIDARLLYWILVRADLPRLCTKTTLPGLNRDAAYGVRVVVPAGQVAAELLAVIDVLDDLAVSAVMARHWGRVARHATLDALLSGERSLPLSYDRFVEVTA